MCCECAIKHVCDDLLAGYVSARICQLLADASDPVMDPGSLHEPRLAWEEGLERVVTGRKASEWGGPALTTQAKSLPLSQLTQLLFTSFTILSSILSLCNLNSSVVGKVFELFFKGLGET